MKLFVTTTTCSNLQFCWPAYQCSCLGLVCLLFPFFFSFPELCQGDKRYLYQDYISNVRHNTSTPELVAKHRKCTAATVEVLWTFQPAFPASGAARDYLLKAKCRTDSGGQSRPEETTTELCRFRCKQWAPSLQTYRSASTAAGFLFHGFNPATDPVHSFEISKQERGRKWTIYHPNAYRHKLTNQAVLVGRSIWNFNEEWKCCIANTKRGIYLHIVLSGIITLK